MKQIINSLAPKILTEGKDIKKIVPYLSAIQKALNTSDINNIALTGAYGSGKSTIIKTFKERNPKYEYLNISLATFKDEMVEDNNEVDSKNVNLDRLIELSILQQIFYHVKPSEIPDSRFKRIRSISDKRLRIISIGIIIWLITVVAFFKYDFIAKLNPNSWTYSFKDFDVTSTLIIGVFFIGIGVFLNKLIRIFNSSKIKKLSFLNGEMEIGENVDQSIFNKHLDEILYFFENTEFDVVVIEDLDRFKNTEIFTKLREINLLLNNSKSINRKISFIYAIRDDIFKDEERTKFFDNIIPVIPFISPSSANEQLSKLIEEAGLEHDFSDDFKDSVVTFIDDIDMRFLINVFHEYTIYKECLGSELIQDNLLAIIIYKNLYPKDFVDLNKNNGLLYDFISNKKEYIKKMIIVIDEEIQHFEQEISNIQNEQVESIEELKAIYINAIHSLFPSAVSIKIGTEFYSFNQLIEDEAFEELRELDHLVYERYQYNSSYEMYAKKPTEAKDSFMEVENKVNKDFSYEERKEHIIDKNNNKIEELRTKIEDLKNRKNEIQLWTLKKVFETLEITPYISKFANSNLMQNLLLNGYIDENYSHYITLFHEVNITKEDYDFERNIKKGTPCSFDYRLTKIKNLVKKIPVTYFRRKSILNYELLAFLITNRETYEEKYEALINLLISKKYGSEEEYNMFSFIKGYIFNFKIDDSTHKGYTQKRVDIFINEIINKWDRIWLLISGLPEKDKNTFLKLLIKHVPHTSFKSLNQSSNLKNYISNNSNLLSLPEKEDEQKMANILQVLDVKFEALTTPDEQTKNLFDFVYENNHYKINIENIHLIFRLQEEKFDEGLFNKSNYTYILNSKNKHLKNYINKNIEFYIKHVMLKLDSNNFESEDNLLNIYNDEDINEKLKFELIKKQETLISDFSEMNDEGLSPNFIKHLKIENTWNNIFTYFNYSSNKIDEVLIDYLNQKNKYSELSKVLIKDNVGQSEDDIKTFIIELITCNKLTLESYSSILRSTHYYWDSLSFENLDIDKVKHLIDSGKLNLTQKNYDKLKEVFPKLHISLIERKPTSLLSKYDDLNLEEDDILLLLKSKKYHKENKLKLIQQLEEDIIIDNEKIGSVVCDILANTKFVPLSYEVIESLFEHSKSTENRIKVFNLNFESLGKEQIKTLIDLLPYPYKNIAQRRKKPTIKKSESNLKLVKSLVKINFISSYRLNGNQIKIVAKY